MRPGSMRLRVATVDRLPPEQRVGRVVLRDGAGLPCAYGGQASGRYWVLVPNVGSFELSPFAVEVNATVYAKASRDLVLDGYYGTALPMLAQAALGYEALHASAILVNGSAIVFCGETGVGKSTIAAGLRRRGFALWADDAVALTSVPGGIPVSVFLPFTVEGRTVSAAAGNDEVPLAAVCLLERVAPGWGSRAGAISRASPSEAVAAMLSQAYRFAPQPPERRRQMVQTYLDVAARIPVLLLRFPPDRDRLPELMDRIEAAVRKGISERA